MRPCRPVVGCRLACARCSTLPNAAWSPTLLPPRTAPEGRTRKRGLEQLADFLLGDEVAFRKLDEHRERLAVSPTTFAALLGVTRRSLDDWRRAGRMSLRGRERMHDTVLRAVGSGGSVYAPQNSEPLRTGTDADSYKLPSRNRRKTPEVEGLAVSTGPARAPIAAPSADHPRAWPELGFRGRAAAAYIRRLHAPEPGDAHAACECLVCYPARRAASL